MTVNPKSYHAYMLMHNGILALAEAEQQGIRVDMKYVNRKLSQLEKSNKLIEEEFQQTKFYRLWKHTFGHKTNINSDTQLGHLLYDVKGYEPSILTPTGKGSVNRESLIFIDDPDLNILIEKTKIKKISDFLMGFVNEEVGGFIHPFYNLHTVVTYRGSSDSPNFQNNPIRDEMMKNAVRRALFPRIDHQLLEVDFKAIEVAVNACINHDERLINYVSDPSTDMHGDMAKQIFMLDEIDKSSDYGNTLRQAAKNGFVFPEFYGDYYKKCAAIICNWIKLPQTKFKKGQGLKMSNEYISDHLINSGIKEFGISKKINGKWKVTGFIKHLQEIEDDFWNIRFPQYTQWKKDHFEEYQKLGYFDLPTGFRCSGVMRKNQVLNSPGQGSAFHCLLWSLIEINKRFKEKKLDTKIVGQIHDSLIIDANPKEIKDVVDICVEITTKKLAEHWDWIIVPMRVDMEICEINQPWSTKKKFKFAA